MKINKILAKALVLLICTGMIVPGNASEITAVSKNITDSPTYDKKQTVSMDFENADLKSVLKAFSMQTGINFVASDIVENKKITVYLSGVMIESALASILRANGLRYEKETGNVYIIKPTGKGDIRTITKIFRLNFLQVYKMSVGAGATGSTSGITIIGQPAVAGAASTTSTMANPTPQAETDGGGNDSNQPKNIIDVIKSLMTKYGRIVADRRNNSLIVTDIPDVFDSIEETIKALDIEPIQIMIQAEIIETTTSALKRIGIEYGNESQLASVTYTGSSSTSGGSASSSNPTIPVPFPLTENFIKDTFNTSLSQSGLFSYGTLRIADTEIVLKLLSQDSDTKYLSRPKIMTINNEPAVIKISANTAIGSNSTSVSTTGQSIATAERTETGVILKVTPQVNDSGDIFMFIEPSVSRATVSTLSANFKDPSYRTSASTVMIRDMETVVVAGLIQTNNFKTSRKIPFLGDIPILGEPFKSRYTQIEDTELLIFITPHIVKRRDAEFVTTKSTRDREHIIEKMLKEYSEGQEKKDNNPFWFFSKSANKREESIDQSIKKYSASTNVEVKKKG